MRAALVASIVVGLVSRAAAEPAVDADLRALADRAARYTSPAGLDPLVEERLAAGDTTGLADVLRARTGGDWFVEDGWLAAAHGGAGDRAQVVRLAAAVEREMKAPGDDPMRDAARCGVAMAFERLGDPAGADAWRKQATGVNAWCPERLPAVAARRGAHDRATALLAELPAATRVTAILAVAEVYTGGADQARVAPLLEEAAKLVEETSSSLMSPALVWPKLAAAWAAAGNQAQAKVLAKKALASLDEALLLIQGDVVAAGLLAAGETAALAKLVARMEKARAKDDRLVARIQNARVVAKFGSKKRAAKLVAAVAAEVDTSSGAMMAGGRFALIDAYLALGDLPAAIHQASLTSVTSPIEVEALIKVARHCRKTACKRSPAVTEAIAAVGARLDKFDALRNRKP